MDESQLLFDPTDDNGDGIPDAVRIDAPPAFAANVIYNPTDSDGELDVVLFSLASASVLDENPFLTIEFTVNTLDNGVGNDRHANAFSVAPDPPPSAGLTTGVAVELRPASTMQLTPLSAEPTSQIFLPVVGSG